MSGNMERKIPKSFKRWKSTWTLIDRTDKRALYHRLGDPGGEWWEVVGIGRRDEEGEIMGTKLEIGEFLKLGDNSYGKETWCFGSEEKARQKLNE